jgi:2-polyprenyl-3-methyl-5-hydroxy-6-metoxy-1,4-benzoquinol methylase
MHMIRTLTDYENSQSFVNRLRNERHRFFDERLRALGQRKITILDVGGYERFWMTRGFEGRTDVDITVLNLEREPTHSPNIRSVAGDACDMHQFADHEFDVVFSNSVIEHLHTFENQRAMAREVQRVGRHHFVQTPNRYFIIEPHYLLPAFQFLPRPVQHGLLTRTSLSRSGRMAPSDADAMLAEIRLLSLAEVKALFPHSRIYSERLLGMTKSFTAYSL